MKIRHDKAQLFLATLSDNCPELPFEPTLLPELFASTADSSTKSLDTVAGLVERSQGLAARVLRVANSAYYGMQTTVSSLPHAVRLLGLNEVRNIILQIGTISIMRRLHFPKGFNFEELWEHQVRTAVFAKEMALSLPKDALGRKASPDDIYAAGLLHDLGKTMLASNCPDDWLAIWDLAACEQIPFHKAEEDYWGVDHSIAGARLLTFWGLPANLVELVNWHHAPDLVAAEYAAAARVLAAANLLAHEPDSAFTEQPGEDAAESLHAAARASIPEGVDVARLMEKLAACDSSGRVHGMAEALAE